MRKMNEQQYIRWYCEIKNQEYLQDGIELQREISIMRGC